eukprot:s403_g12.t1
MDARWQYCNQSSFDEIMNLTLASLADASSPVILSSEEFSNLQDTGWRLFLEYFQNATRTLPCFAMSPVLFLRRPTSWLRSDWVQTFYSSDNPMPFGNWFLKLVGHTPDHQLQKYSWLIKAFGASTTQVVSFDYLLEVNQSLQSYLICNATLGRVGASWTQCDLLVNSKEMVAVNLGLDSRTVDVVRLARNMYNQHSVTNDTQCKFKLVPSDPQVESVARWLPKECFTLEKLHWKMETELLYNLTGINRPSERDEKVCVVNEAALQRKDWEQIRRLLPNCLRT